MKRSLAVAVIHPDHLLDRARTTPSGPAALAPEEWQKLGAHLSVCPACAWEQATTDDFARERASGAGPGDLNAVQLDGLIGGALARAGLGEEPRVTVLRPARSAARRLAAAAMIAAAVGALLALPARAAHEGPRDGPPLVAASEASLDAGALGSPSGGDS
jgi:hypothetical protein